MKRITAFILVAVMLAAMLCVPSSAEGLKLNKGTIRFNIYKADPDNIVKDGKIGENEYHKLDESNDPDDTLYYIIFGRGSGAYDSSIKMLETMEYYFSWDEVHGLNLAVRCAPPDVHQELDVNKTGSYPEDGFLNNCGLGISVSDKYMSNDQADILYYAIARRTDTLEYLQGWYDQLGLNDDYKCEAEEDFVIEYTEDGYITYEWSIPMEYFMSGNITAGRSIFLSLFAMAGDAKSVNYTDCYGVSLGDRCYFRITTDDTRAAVGVLSDTKVEDAVGIDSSLGLSAFFDDTEDEAWYSSYVMEAFSTGLMQGKGDRVFAPNVGMTRAELVTLLYRNEGSPAVRYDKWYTDVADGEWYTDAVVWSAKCGIVSGYPDRTFGPNDLITREQIAAIMYRYAQYKKVTLRNIKDKLSDYPDSGDISDYAYDAMKWANFAGLIRGKAEGDGTSKIYPKSNATRAEVATIVLRYIEKY